jgi:hypothetical protein
LIGGTGNQKTRLIDEQIPVKVPAIVSREIWERAQAKRVYNIKFSPRKMKRPYLLRGMLFCGCGRGMVGTNGVYYCTRRYRSDNEPVCSEPFVKGNKVEYIAWGYILRLLTNADEFEQDLRDAQALEAVQMQPKQKELEHVIALLADTDNEAEQIAATAKKIKGIVGKKLQAQREWLEALQTRVTVCNGIAKVTCRLGGESLRATSSQRHIFSPSTIANADASMCSALALHLPYSLCEEQIMYPDTCPLNI